MSTIEVAATPKTNETENPLVQEISLDKIKPSKANPRHRADDAALSELAKNIKTHGVLQPILVRPVPDGDYEIVYGERRWRASKAAGKGTIPARIVDISDTEARELAIVENLQREDVHALDEAKGFKELVALNADLYTVETIAAKIGRTPAYVYGRLRIAELIPDVQTAFYEGKLTVAHALEIARIQPKDQERALSECFPGYRTTAAILKDRKADCITVRQLRDWIEREIHLDLAQVPFDTADANLVPAAGACTACPKQTGNNKLLFPEFKKKGGAICTDPTCYKSKVDALVEISTKALIERNEKPVKVAEGWRHHYGEKPSSDVLYDGDYRRVSQGECPSTQAAVVVDGRNAGKTLYICADAKCKTHRHTSAYQLSPEEREQRRQIKLAQRVQQQSRRRTLDAIREKLTGELSREDLEMLAVVWFERLGYEHQRRLVDVYGWEKKKTKTSYGTESVDYRTLGEGHIRAMELADLNRFLIIAALVPDLYCASYYSGATFSEDSKLALTATRYGVDVAKITIEVQAELSNKKRTHACKVKSLAPDTN